MGLRRFDRHGARPPNAASPRLRRPSLRVPSRTAARLDQQVRSPPLPWLAPSRSPAHRTAVLPTCSGGTDLGQRGHQGCGPRRQRVWRAVQPRMRRARRQQIPKGGRRAGEPVQSQTTPCSRLLCQQGRGGSGSGGSGPITVSTCALVAAGSAAVASGGGAGGGAPCALRLILIPPGAPRGSQAPRAAWACSRHASQTLGGVGGCWVGFLCSVGRLWAYLGDFGVAHRPPTVAENKSWLWRVGGRVPGGTLRLLGGGMHSPKCLFSSVCEAAAIRHISSFFRNPP